MRTSARVVGGLGAVLLLGACSVVDLTEPGDAPPPPETDVLRVGVGNAIETAPVRIAVENGVFERAGLRVELVEQTGGKAALESLTNGQLDVAFASNVALFRAAADGTPLRLQGEAYVAGSDSMALVTPPDAEVTEPGDLHAPRIAVAERAGLGTLTSGSVLDTVGIDEKSITFVPGPTSGRMEALRAGEVDAAWMVEPYITLAQKDHGARVLADCARGATETFPMSSYASTKEFTEGHPRALALFRHALAEAQRLGTDHTRVRQALPRLTDLDEVTASLVSLGSYPPVVNAVRLQRVADLMQGAGMLRDRLDVRSMVPEPELS
ncbi:ABC transporter substrate-binding protein [Saccharomonospora saliphila]|uniref:ABC transporter substrate-binding protein n=1 Tax=Saccharomonospora saliphila TaxID=369829 RepID=UPI00048EA509|nr:ABC transporter substrate-binding protein [Saccharomonospora saliphila]